MTDAALLLTEDEAAGRLRVCARTLRKERQAGRLHYVLIGRRILYAPGDLEQYIERARTVTPMPPARPGVRKVASNRGNGVIVPFSQRRGARG